MHFAGIVSPVAFMADPQGFAHRPAGAGSLEFVSCTKDSDIVFERFR